MRQFLLAGLIALVALSGVTGLQAEVITQWDFNRDDVGNLPDPLNPAPSTGAGFASLYGGVLATGSGFASGNVNGKSSDPADITISFNSPLGNNAWQINGGWDPDAASLSQGVSFAVSTVGTLDNVVVSWDLRQSNTSSRFGAFQYTIDGFNWITLTDPTRITIGTDPIQPPSIPIVGTVSAEGLMSRTQGDRWLNVNQADLSGLGAGNNPNFAFRIVTAHDPDSLVDPEDPESGTTFVRTTLGTPPIAAAGTWRFDMVTVAADPLPDTSPSLVNAQAYHGTFPNPGEDWTPVDGVKQVIVRGESDQLVGLINLTSSSRGINGLVLDFEELDSLDDISLEYTWSPQGAFVEASHPVDSWESVPVAPTSISFHLGEGVGGSNRALIRWANAAIINRYLGVKVIHNDEVIAELYLGNLLGKVTAPSGGLFSVGNADVSTIRVGVGSNVPAGSQLDIDKNSFVNNTDISSMRSGIGVLQLRQITIPALPGL